MLRMARTPYNGEVTECEPIPIERAREQWSEGVLAVGGTIGVLSEVYAVLWTIEGQHIRVVTAVRDYCDESLERVAEKELELMDALPEFLLEFRVVPRERLRSFLGAGYVTVLERQTEQT